MFLKACIKMRQSLFSEQERRREDEADDEEKGEDALP